jgi:hypothetical protein
MKIHQTEQVTDHSYARLRAGGSVTEFSCATQNFLLDPALGAAYMLDCAVQQMRWNRIPEV